MFHSSFKQPSSECGIEKRTENDKHYYWRRDDHPLVKDDDEDCLCPLLSCPDCEERGWQRNSTRTTTSILV
jgi:hypothetical protein